jgi:hypothetical protein
LWLGEPRTKSNETCEDSLDVDEPKKSSDTPEPRHTFARHVVRGVLPSVERDARFARHRVEARAPG